MADYSTGLELVLNACEGVLQIALTENEKPLCFQEWFDARKATEILAPALREIFARTGRAAVHIRRIGCFAGPGSFTGIRLALATASALRRAGHAQLASLDYLQALATSAVCQRGLLYPGRVIAITHARHDLLHFQMFCSYGPQIPAQPVTETRLLSPRDALTAMAEAPCLVAGSGIKRHAELFLPKATGQGLDGAPDATVLPELVRPNLTALCLLARHGDYFPRDIEPKYVRGCDAAENLEAKAGPESGAIAAMRAIMRKQPKSEI